MASGIRTSVKIEGLDKLRKAFRELPLAVQKNALARSTAKGAEIIGRDAQSRALTLQIPDKRRIAGLLRRSIYFTKGKRSDSSATAFVGVRRLAKGAVAVFKRATGQKGSGNPSDPFYWSILEFGKSKRTAHPFMRPAFDTQKEAAAKAIIEDLRKGVDEEAKKLGWKL